MAVENVKVEKKRLTPRRAIRARCLDCSAGSPKEVTECWDEDCALYEHRSGHRPASQVRTPCKAIRAYCLRCCNGSAKEVRLCPSTDRSLHIYRFGKNPAVKPTGRGEALQRWRESQREQI